MMRMLAIRTTVAVLVLSLAACASVRKFDRDAMSRFAMTAPGAWTMTVTTAANYPIDSGKHEAIRLGWIEDHIRANGCTTFEVVDRQLTLAPTDRFTRTGWSDNVGTLAYSGTCR